MPIKTPSQKVKVSCPNCGWHLIVNRGGLGDCLIGQNAWRFTTNQTDDYCPDCGVKELRDTPATYLERVNPAEYMRKLNYVFFKRGKRKSCT